MGNTPTVNTHIHTPFSFTSFESVKHAVELAKGEGITALGISDFNTVEGFDEFDRECRAARIYPLYNIEFIAFSPDDKKAARRWNDPKNPGIMYFCGKALRHPAAFSTDSRNTLASLWKGTQDYVFQTIEKLNAYLASRDLSVSFTYNDIRASYAKNTVRERHIAKAVYHAFESRWSSSTERLAQYRILFSDAAFSSDTSNSVGMQNEIRNRLLKAGKPAYVEEKQDAFLSLSDVTRIILDGGGIPCYPVLADDSGPLNECEADVARLAEFLTLRNIHAVEFIPLRNSLDILKRYVAYFNDKGFCVTFGTEHNTPELYSLVPSARGGVPFDEELQRIAWRGACILAAHQRRVRSGLPGFVDKRGVRAHTAKALEEFVRAGEREIQGIVGEAA